ncbi:MAG: LPS export ABC transporter periplasmic protein LptC [Bacteroidales bacterium]
MLPKGITKSIVTLFGLAMLLSCQSDLESIEAVTHVDEGPIETAIDVEIIYSDEGHVRMIMEAPRMDRYENEDPYLELPRGLDVVFYDSLENQTSRMSSKYAISYEETEIIEARNDVVVVNEKGERLNTEHLTWNQQEETIFSEKFVKITTDDEVLYGEGLEADERFDSWRILDPHGTFQVDTGEGEDTGVTEEDMETPEEAGEDEAEEPRELPEETEEPEELPEEVPEEMEEAGEGLRNMDDLEISAL